MNKNYLHLLLLLIIILQSGSSIHINYNLDLDEVSDRILDTDASYNTDVSTTSLTKRDSTKVAFYKKNMITNTATSNYFSFTFNDSLSFIRSGDYLTFTVTPSVPSTMFFHWDQGTNSTFMPLAPTIDSNNVNETHILQIFSERPDNSWEVYSQSFVIDDTAIVVTKKSPSNVKVSGYETIDLNYYPASIKARTWAFNNFPFTITEPITFPKDQNDIPIPGQQILHVKAVDQANRVWSYDFPYYVDFIAPLINPINFVNSTIIPSGTELVFQNKTPTGIYDDHYFFDFSWNNGPSFTHFPIVPSPSGLNTLSVSLKDEVGNENFLKYVIYSKINFITRPKLAYKPTEQLEAIFTESPAYTNYTLVFTGNNSIITGNSTTLPFLPASETFVRFLINVRDTSNNWLNESFTIKVDSSKIIFSYSTPVNNTIIDQSIQNANINLHFQEIPFVLIYNWNTTNANFTSIPSIPSYIGNFKLFVYFSDLAGNWDKIVLVYSRRVYITANITTRQIIEPDSTIQLSTSGTIDHYDYYFNNESSTSFDTSTSLVNITAPGTSSNYVLQVRVISNDTKTIFSVLFTVKISVNFQDSTVNPYHSGVKINFTFSETPKSWYYVWESVNDVSKYQFDGMPILPSVDGQHTLYIKAINANGDIEFINAHTFTTDDTVPVIYLDSSKNINNTYLKAHALLVFKGLSADVANLLYTWNEGTFQSISSSNIAIYTPETNGTHSLKVYLKDKAGNENTYRYLFHIDAIKPTIFSSVVNNSEVLITSYIEFNFSEPLSPLSSYKDKADTKSIQNNQIIINDFGFGNKSFDVVISAVDTFGNNETERFHFIIVDPALQYSFSVPENYLFTRADHELAVYFSKDVKQLQTQWSLNGVVIVDEPHYKVNNTFYKIELPFSDGQLTLHYSILTYDDYWTNNSSTFTKDTVAPQIKLQLKQFNASTNQDRYINSTESATFTSLDANAYQTIYFTELTDFSGTISFSFGKNHTVLTYKFSSSKDFNYDSETFLIKGHKYVFKTPGKSLSVVVKLTITDRASNTASYTWDLTVYDSPEISPFSPIYIVFIAIGFVVWRRKYHE